MVHVEEQQDIGAYSRDDFDRGGDLRIVPGGDVGEKKTGPGARQGGVEDGEAQRLRPGGGGGQAEREA
jgi:hypothetical protein